MLSLCGLSEAEFSILLTSDPLIRSLNREYRGIDRATDVLAFSQQEGEPVPGNDAVLGDVVISLETARRQAEDYGASFDEEITRLLIHGLLHLLGYDHERGPEQRRKMRRKERDLLRRLNAHSTLD